MRIWAVYIAWPLMAVTFEMATRSGQVAAINLGQLFPALIPEVSLPSFVPGTLSESFSFDVSDIISPIQYEWLTVLCDDYDRVSQCLLERDFPVSIPRCTVAILGQIRREICPLPVAGKERSEAIERLGKDTALITALAPILFQFPKHLEECTEKKVGNAEKTTTEEEEEESEKRNRANGKDKKRG